VSRAYVHALLLTVFAAAMLALSAGPASAAPDLGRYGPAIDTYARYDVTATECSNTEQPGVRDFRAILQQHYGANGGGILRTCSSASSSAHHSGRAYDWMLDAGRAADRAKADEVLGWLLATDEHGNRHAMARRFGVMYIIWDRHIWHAWDADAGWKPYNGWSPHTDHIHFSFSWAGARRETSFWTGQLPRRDAANMTWLDADLNGDGTAETVGYDPGTGEWLVGRDGQGSLAVWATYRTRTGWTEHVVGDFLGEGRDQILSYHQDTGRWWLNRPNGSGFTSQVWTTFATRTGWSHQLAADLDGNGRAALLSYHPGSGRLWVHQGDPGAVSGQLGTTFPGGSAWTTHVVGDFTGVGGEEVASFDQGTGRWTLTSGGSGGALTTTDWGRYSTTSGWSDHLVGDFRGDGHDQLASYHPGAGTWWISGGPQGSFRSTQWARFSTRTGWDFHQAADLVGDGRADIVSYHPGAGSLWVSASTGSSFTGSRWGTYATRTGWSGHLVGDVEGRGRASLLSFHPSNGSLWHSRSDGGQFATSRWTFLP
jgi:hypothetical protein